MIWIITRSINDYNQDGDYFHSAFINKPTKEELIKLFPNEDDKFIDWLLKGGGRMGTEDEWFYLEQIEIGAERYERM